MHDDITDVPGMRVGHDTNLEAGTGCTVILCDTPAVGGVDVRGGAPATHETDLLHPLQMVEEVHAILLTGGSAFGLGAASGVMRYLEEHDIGLDIGVARVPIVPAAAILDLAFGSASVRPDDAAGYRACEQATTGPIKQGNVGAGTGATVGKTLGPEFAMKGGLGSASTPGHRWDTQSPRTRSVIPWFRSLWEHHYCRRHHERSTVQSSCQQSSSNGT